MPDGGLISINAAAVVQDPGTVVELRIEDSGIGMTRETVLRAFDPFFTTKATGLGGVGLPTVKHFCRAARRSRRHRELRVGHDGDIAATRHAGAAGLTASQEESWMTSILVLWICPALGQQSMAADDRRTDAVCGVPHDGANQGCRLHQQEPWISTQEVFLCRASSGSSDSRKDYGMTAFRALADVTRRRSQRPHILAKRQ